MTESVEALDILREVLNEYGLDVGYSFERPIFIIGQGKAPAGVARVGYASLRGTRVSLWSDRATFGGLADLASPNGLEHLRQIIQDMVWKSSLKHLWTVDYGATADGEYQ